MMNNLSNKADAIFNASQKRDAAKEMAARQRAAFDAKLAKLREFRLAKEEADKKAARLKSTMARAQKKRSRPKPR